MIMEFPVPSPSYSGVNPIPAPSPAGTSYWIGGTTYVSAADVLGYLQIQNPTQADYNLLNQTILPIVCDYLDTITGHTWGVKTVTNEIYSIGKPTYMGWYLVGTPIFLLRKPVIPASSTYTLQSLKIWNGNEYQEWVGNMVEGRWGSYWVDTLNGIVWIVGWYWFMGYEASITYQWGYNVAGSNGMDGQIRYIALLKAAKMFLDNNRYTAEISQGIGGIEMDKFWNWLNEEIPKQEDAIKGTKVPTIGFIP